jgi:hypothetical protein
VAVSYLNTCRSFTDFTFYLRRAILRNLIIDGILTMSVTVDLDILLRLLQLRDVHTPQVCRLITLFTCLVTHRFINSVGFKVKLIFTEPGILVQFRMIGPVRHLFYVLFK